MHSPSMLNTPAIFNIPANFNNLSPCRGCAKAHSRPKLATGNSRPKTTPGTYHFPPTHQPSLGLERLYMPPAALVLTGRFLGTGHPPTRKYPEATIRSTQHRMRVSAKPPARYVRRDVSRNATRMLCGLLARRNPIHPKEISGGYYQINAT